MTKNKDCIFREIEVSSFYEDHQTAAPNASNLLMKTCVLAYTPPALLYSDQTVTYQAFLHDVVTFFEDINGCLHKGQNKVMRCEFITMEVTAIEAMCWAHLWATEADLKATTRY